MLLSLFISYPPYLVNGLAKFVWRKQKQPQIPAAFARGFLALSETADFLYKAADLDAEACEHALRWDDATLKIDWLHNIPPHKSQKRCFRFFFKTGKST
ncbi:MAG: dTDP-4-dehydrorhamnose 3,5-epimerase family protein [Planctomycetaceae bacterium]|nr:dTDP-4-dehydrorhamnose 3,5-epimerase family protein [Planctomycetaceae bacterium]